MLDFDWSLVNFHWFGASAFYHKHFPFYHPTTFFQKENAITYVRHYVPELSEFPEEHLFEPWKCPKDQQLAAGCVIGTDYPEPIVDHIEASKRNMQMMTEAYIQMANLEMPETDEIHVTDEILRTSSHSQ